MSLVTTFLPFQTPLIKNAKVVKLELNPFLQNIISHYTQPLPFENEPHTLETIPLIREHLDTYLFYIRYKVLTITTEYPTFQISFPQQGPNSSHIYRRTINPINLQVPINQVFHAFLNNVKDHNLTNDTPRFSPNALEDLERYINNFDVEIIERIVNPEDNPHHWLQADILRIQNFIYHYFKDLTLNDQTISQIKVISLFLRKYFRFNYQLLWSQQDQSAFTEFPDHFTADECLPFIINKQNENPYFHKPQSITKQTLDYIRFDPLLITENITFPDNRPFSYEQSSQVQQHLHSNINNLTENDNTPQQQHQNEHENYNENEFPTQESTISTHNPSQTGTSSVHTQSFRAPTRIVDQRRNTRTPQSSLDASPNRNITFFIPNPDETHETHDETHDTIQDDVLTTSIAQNTSVNVASPTRTTLDPTRYITQSRYDPPSVPSVFRSNRSVSSNINYNENPQTSNQHYDPFNYNFYPSFNATTNTNINQNHTTTTQNIHAQNQGTSHPSTSYAHVTQAHQRRLQNPPLTRIPTDPLYQMHSNPNPNPNPLPQNTIQHVPPQHAQQLATPIQYLPMPQDTFINMSASIPEPIKPFDGLDHSYTPEEYLQQVEARLTFAIGEEPQNNPIKYKYWHNRRMAYIQCSLTGTALDWYTNLHISYKQQWNSFVQLFKKQFSSQKTAYYAQVEAMSLMKKDNETVRHFALRVQQLVKKGWCNENAATINLKNNEIFTKGLPKKLKDFAHKRQVKHVSTLLEPSIPFHTLVRHVDSEDIANEKIRTNDLALEINKVSLEDDNSRKEFENEDHIMVTQSGDPNNKSKPAYRKYCSYCHKNNHSISNCYQKQRDDEYHKHNNQRSRTPQQSFVQYFRSKPNNPQENQNKNTNIYSSDNDRNKYNQNYFNDRYRNNDRYRSNSRETLQNNYRSNSRQRYYNRSRSPYRSRFDNYYQRRTPSRSPYRTPYRNNSNYRYNSRSRYRSRSQSQENSFKRYNHPYRSPSRPRDFRSRSRTPSRNRQQNRINQVDVKTTKDNDSTKFEIHTCQTSEIANTITPYSWFYPLYVHASETNDSILPTKLEILFLLDTGASISVLNLPTFYVISKQLNINVPTNLQNQRAKTLTVANQTEVPIIHYISITCFTEVNHQTRSFNIDFAVANIKYNILGTPFFKNHIQNIDFQQNVMTYKEQHSNLPIKTTFSTFTEKDYPYISYIYTIKCKEPIHFKPRSGKTIYFPIKNYSHLHFELEDNTKFYPTNPYTYFLQKFKNIFHFLDMMTNDKSKDSCATIIQNFTSQPATLPRGIIGYIEIPITQTTPSHYRVHDVNSLIHSVIHAYHPDITTPIKPNPYTDMNLCTRVTPQSLLEINKIEIKDKTLQLPIPSVIGNLQPSDKIRKDFPPLPYSTENQQFIKKFNFEYSDLTDTEYVNLCNILINNQHCYAKHKNDVGKISTPFRIRIKDNCKLHTQRPSKVPIHYRDRLNKLLQELEKYNIIKQIGSKTDEKHTIGTTFLNPLIIIPKGDSIKVVLDARHLNSNTNQELESWPIEPLAPQLARANKKYKSTIDLMYAYAHTPLDEETIKLTGFSSGDKLYAFIRGFYGLKGLPNFFTKQMSTFFRSLIDKRSALVYIDDILLLANEKQEMFELIKELHIIASRENLKLAPEKSFYMLLKVKFLGHEIGNNTIKPIPSKIEAIKRIPSPKEKKDVMQFLGSVNFYSKFIEKLHINLKPLYTLLHDDVKFQWTPELEAIFQNVKNAMTADTELTIPNTTNPFFITVDASLVGLGAVLFQMNEENKMKVISYNSRILNTQEQKLSTLDRELLAIVYALQIYEFLIIGSPHPIYLFTDHKPLLHCFAKKGNLSPRFYRAQMQLTKFSKLKIIHTPGKNLTVADMLSRTFTKKQLQVHQLRHKQLPPQIEFSILKDNQIKPVHYLVKHEEIKYNQKNDCHPILADYGDDQFSIRINNKGEDIHIKPLDSFSFQSIVPFESKYKRPTKNQAKSLLQQSTILNDTDILSDEDEPTQSNNVQYQTKEHTFAIQYPTKSDYCKQQVPFLTRPSSNTKIF